MRDSLGRGIVPVTTTNSAIRPHRDVWQQLRYGAGFGALSGLVFVTLPWLIRHGLERPSAPNLLWSGLEVLSFTILGAYFMASFGDRVRPRTSTALDGWTWRIGIAFGLLAVVSRLGYVPRNKILSVSVGIEVVVIFAVVALIWILAVLLRRRSLT